MARDKRRPQSDAKSRWDSLPRYQGRCNRYLVQIPTRRIGYVNAVLESYEWIARIQTADIERGILEICVPEAWDDVFQGSCEQLAREVPCVFMGWERDGKFGGKMTAPGSPATVRTKAERRI